MLGRGTVGRDGARITKGFVYREEQLGLSL